MLYEYNGKTYIKPFSNKIVEVEVTKRGNEYDVKPTNKKVEITAEIKAEIKEITLENAYKKTNKSERNSLDTL